VIDDTTNRSKGGDGCNQEASLRLPHVALDLASRRLKGLKIERLLDLADQPRPLRVLEIGAGSGGIASYFGTHPQLRCEVDAVDVHDNRAVTEGYRYQQVQGTQLPFANNAFDLVLTNHVIEHVGNEAAQRSHLMEIRRVLSSGGIGYLAVPNRWMLMEPHYRLLFLSWLPQAFADAYVRFMGKGNYYDCRPLTTRRLEAMLREVGFEFAQRHREALLLTYELEHPDAIVLRRLLQLIPGAAYVAMRRAFPTLIYTLRLASPVATGCAASGHG
jgi:ubiquinone/menaquinone biosynthesis C-methylase UbiE